MAEATVFVDDAVTGRLPPVCVKDGLPTSDRLTVRQMVGDGTQLGIAWLLVLAVGYLQGAANVFPAFVLLGLAGGGFILWAQAQARRASIDVSLDASRWWVTIAGVHPAFADAVGAVKGAQ